MGRGPILSTVASLMLPFVAMLALHLLIEGHNRPGGGFIAGVLVAAGLALQLLAHPVQGEWHSLQSRALLTLGLGLLLAAGTGLVGMFKGLPYLTSLHAQIVIPVIGSAWKLSLAFMFDIGVFLLVVGGLMTAILALGED